MTEPTSRQSWRSERGQSMIETALMLPLLLFVCIGILEFGRAFQTWQIITNAAREGARMAVLPSATADNITSRVKAYLTNGALPKTAVDATDVAITPDSKITLASGATVSSAVVTVNYPFKFMVLAPIAKMVVKDSKLGGDFTMTSSAEMRNESPF